MNDKNQQLSCWHLAFLYCTELRNYFLTIPDIKDYRFAGDGQQYMAALGWLRLGPLLFSGVTVMVLVAAWIYLRYRFFRPLSELIYTMERIRANDLESRPGRYSSREFAQVNETFSSMIAHVNWRMFHVVNPDKTPHL